MASGTVLATSGPLALLLGYIIMSVVVWSVVSILAEMTTYLPLKGSTVPYLINRYLDPSLAFAAGWNYWYSASGAQHHGQILIVWLGSLLRSLYQLR